MSIGPTLADDRATLEGCESMWFIPPELSKLVRRLLYDREALEAQLAEARADVSMLHAGVEARDVILAGMRADGELHEARREGDFGLFATANAAREAEIDRIKAAVEAYEAHFIRRVPAVPLPDGRDYPEHWRVHVVETLDDGRDVPALRRAFSGADAVAMLRDAATAGAGSRGVQDG